MFQFPGLAPLCLCIQQRVTRHDPRRVSPFGHLRIKAYVRLPEAFRSLSRPSSPVRAKASTVRPFPLDRISSADDFRPPHLRITHACGAWTFIPKPEFSNLIWTGVHRTGRSTLESFHSRRSYSVALERR